LELRLLLISIITIVQVDAFLNVLVAIFIIFISFIFLFPQVLNSLLSLLPLLALLASLLLLFLIISLFIRLFHFGKDLLEYLIDFDDDVVYQDNHIEDLTDEPKDCRRLAHLVVFALDVQEFHFGAVDEAIWFEVGLDDYDGVNVGV